MDEENSEKKCSSDRPENKFRDRIVACVTNPLPGFSGGCTVSIEKLLCKQMKKHI